MEVPRVRGLTLACIQILGSIQRERRNEGSPSKEIDTHHLFQKSYELLSGRNEETPSKGIDTQILPLMSNFLLQE